MKVEEPEKKKKEKTAQFVPYKMTRKDLVNELAYMGVGKEQLMEHTLEDLLDAFHGMLKMCNLLPNQNKALVLKTFNEQGGDEA